MTMPSAAPEKWIADNSELLNGFLEYASNRGDAVGLAANQCSLDGERMKHRFFAMRVDDAWRIVVDPQIIDRSGNPETLHEGCLTWPGKKVVAERYPEITVSYFTIDGEYVQSEGFKDFNAQLFQHEYDHLDGINEALINSDYMTYKRDKPKVGRNDPCPCDSGKKYKKCCGK